jgi:hypothetical protein
LQNLRAALWPKQIWFVADCANGDQTDQLALVAVLVVIGSLGFIADIETAADVEERETMIRSPVVVGERLGATFGGSTVAEASFEKAASAPRAQFLRTGTSRTGTIHAVDDRKP